MSVLAEKANVENTTPMTFITSMLSLMAGRRVVIGVSLIAVGGSLFTAFDNQSALACPSQAHAYGPSGWWH